MAVTTKDMKGKHVIMNPEQRSGAAMRALGQALAENAQLEPFKQSQPAEPQPAQRELTPAEQRRAEYAQKQAERQAAQEQARAERAAVKGWAHYSALERLCIGALMLIPGVVLWWIGGAALVDGGVLGLNIASDVANMSIVIPEATGTARLIALPIIALLFSVVEIKLRPHHPYLSKRTFAVIILLLLAHSVNLGATFLAVTELTPESWELQVWATAQVWPAALWAFFITYVPEILIVQALAALGLDVVLLRVWRFVTRKG